jgi:hypothetical protein
LIESEAAWRVRVVKEEEQKRKRDVVERSLRSVAGSRNS